ncbi:MAG: cation:proton antiporter, partial [Gammaproteobacteria bacterium]|nr:cation:proton antiporter [Gammaproteobacteria bacterium]
MPESIQAIEFFITLGGIFLLGLATDYIGRYTILPRVTLLLIFGIVIGENGLDLIPEIFTNNFYLITNIALLMIGFLLGSKLTYKLLRNASGQLFWISVSGAFVTAIVVTAGLYLVGVALEIAVLLGCISSATAPAATADVVIENNSNNPFSNLLLSIVAIDDAWALILFSLGLALHSVILGLNDQVSPLLHAFHDIGGAILLGVIIGAPASYLSGRIRPGQPILTEALGLVFTCGGLALYFNVSPIIAAMVMGAVIVNFGKHHERT